MLLENTTQLTADIFRGAVPNASKMVVSIVAKATGVFDYHGRMTIDWDVRTPVLHEPLMTPKGEIPSDIAIKKEGVDVMAIGGAYYPGTESGPQSVVAIQVNGDRRHLLVFGDRFWYRRFDGHWAISEAKPFSVLRARWQESYGGSSQDENGDSVVHPLNPEGSGFIACEAAVDETRLPNFEDPDHLIRDWRDQPRPCNVCPAPKHLSFDVEQHAEALQKAGKEPFKVPDSLWNNALPRFRFAAIRPGDRVGISGMSEEPLVFEMPPVRLEAEVVLGEPKGALPLILDTILFLPNNGKCLFTWRASLVYQIRPRETRNLVLRHVQHP